MGDSLNATHLNHYKYGLIPPPPPMSSSGGIVAVEEDDDDLLLTGAAFDNNNNIIINNSTNLPNIQEGIRFEPEDVIPGPPGIPTTIVSSPRSGHGMNSSSSHKKGGGILQMIFNSSQHNNNNNNNNNTTTGGGGMLNKSSGGGGAGGHVLNSSSIRNSINSNSNMNTMSNSQRMDRSSNSARGVDDMLDEDELQLSITEHMNWTGNGILANRADLDLPPEQFAAGCNLLQACARGDLAAIESMLNQQQQNNKKQQKESSHHMMKFDLINFRDYDRRTALHVAASEGYLEVCQFLVKRGAKINRSDRWGGSPLDDAHRHRHTAVIEYLRQHGATTGSGNRLTNLITAAADGDVDEVRTLLRLQQPRGTRGSNNNRNFLKELVNKGDYDKRTALHLAAGEGHTDIVKELCNAGADVNVQDRWKRRPLDDARDGHHEKTVAYLKSVGAIEGDASNNHMGSNNNHTNGSLSNGFGVRENSLDVSANRRAVDNMQIEFTELEMIDRIGSGAFGEIYKCRWRGTLVAAKIIKTAKIRREWVNRKVTDAINRGDVEVDDAIQELDEAEQNELEAEKDLAIADFRQEISVLKSLRHPNIVLLLAYSTTADYECLISELMKCSLLDVFKSHMVQGTRMLKRVQLAYATQLAQGMNYLHTCKPPIIHRDLKPANLLIDHSGVLKISDFGLSKVRPDPEKKETDQFVMTGETGSYRFMAPEVYRHENYNETVDVYSFAMILFYLFVGRPPWPQLAGMDAVQKASDEGDRPTIPRDMDARLQALLKECWDDNPAMRPPFRVILEMLSDYYRNLFHQDANSVVLASDIGDNRCSCAIM